MRRRLIVLGVLCSLAPLALADLRLALAAEPKTGLPAIPPSLRITVENTGAAGAQLHNTAGLQVFPPKGDPFLALAEVRSNEITAALDPDLGEAIPVGPGERRDLTFWQSLDTPWYDADARLWSPGTYRLRLVVGSKAMLAQLREAAALSSGMVISNEATYTVQQPVGQDAVAWDLIRQLQWPASWPDQLAKEIAAKAPQSIYAAYSFPRPQSLGDAVAAYEAAAGRLADTPMAEVFRLTAAQLELQRSSASITARDVDGAARAAQRAEGVLRNLANTGRDPGVRKRAADELATHYFTREEIADYIRRIEGRIPGELEPAVECAERLADGRVKVWFHYFNPADTALDLPIGVTNKFTPAPHDRGQPTPFEKGTPRFVFSLTTNEPQLTWHLAKQAIQLKVREIPDCAQLMLTPPAETP